MHFGSDLDIDAFRRAFADHQVRPLLGLDIPDGAAARIAEDDGLLRNIFDQWRRSQPGVPASEGAPASAPSVAKRSSGRSQVRPVTAPPSSTADRETGSIFDGTIPPPSDVSTTASPAIPSPPTRTPSPPTRTPRRPAETSLPPISSMSDAELRAVAHGTGVAATIIGMLAVVAAWVSMGIGFSLADDRTTPQGQFAFLDHGEESYLVAGDSLFGAAGFAVVGLISFIVAIVRGRNARRRFSSAGGVVGMILVVVLTIVIIFCAVEISTWL